jgi:DNA-binding response OmpR family regulator
MTEPRKPKLLMVDDEPTIVEFTRKIYEKKGYLTFGATDGPGAVAIFQRERPEVTLIDVHMPFSPFDGVETLRRIKEIDKSTCCIMLSRITEKLFVEHSRKYGASAYIRKPFDIEVIDEAIAEATSKPAPPPEHP